MQTQFYKRSSLLATLKAMQPGDELFVSGTDYATTVVRTAAGRAARELGREVRLNVHYNGSGCEVRCFAR